MKRRFTELTWPLTAIGLLLLATMILGHGLAMPTSGNTVRARDLNPNGLHAKFIKHPGKIYFGTGADIKPYELENTAIARLVDEEFGQITSINVMRWDELQPERGLFNWEPADALVDWATGRGKLIRGLALVFHSHVPYWVIDIQDRDELASALEGHIKAVVSRYKDNIYAWDVVFEAISINGTELRPTPLYEALGEDYITIAFKAAREADPIAKLYIHDFNIDKDGPKLQTLLSLVTKVNTAHPGLINGISFESLGYDIKLPPLPIPNRGEDFAKALRLGSAVEGITEVAITGLGARNADPGEYVGVVDACLQAAKCVGVTTEMAADSQWGPARPRGVPNLYLFNDQNAATPAYGALIELLS